MPRNTAETDCLPLVEGLPAAIDELVSALGELQRPMVALARLLLKKLDDLGIADNTIVIITTDNGAETFSWPDGGTTPFRGEKNTNWDGGYRVPCVMRWPGVIAPGSIINERPARAPAAMRGAPSEERPGMPGRGSPRCQGDFSVCCML